MSVWTVTVRELFGKKKINDYEIHKGKIQRIMGG